MTAPQAPNPSDQAITAPDRTSLLRSAALAWTASTVLLGVGALLTAAWLWGAYRGQQQAEDSFGGFGNDDMDLADRVDILLSYSTHLLAYAAIVVAAAFALRLLADIAAVRAGGFTRSVGSGQPTDVTLDRDDD